MLEDFLHSETYGYISIALRVIAILVFAWIVKEVSLWKKPIFAGIGVCVILLGLSSNIEWLHPIYPFIIGSIITIIGYLTIGLAFIIYYKTHSD